MGMVVSGPTVILYLPIKVYTRVVGTIGTSYLAQFQKRAVTNLKNYSTKYV